MLLEDLGKFPYKCLDQLKANISHFFHVTRRSMENSIYTSLDLVKLKISHFAMLFEDLQKFLCTFLDQLQLDISHFVMLIADLW